MTRPRKQTVDYFPHYCHHGKTMTILEQKYGNDGYAFWFKLLELLGSSEGHVIDCNDPVAWEYLQSISHLESHVCGEILDLLSRLQAIDAELWGTRLVWSENFVQGISQAYRNRVVETPPRPSIEQILAASGKVSDVRNPPNKKEGNRKEIKTPLPPKSGGVPFQEIIDAWNTYAPELLPRAELTDKRKPKIKAAWKEHPELEWFTALFADIFLSSWHSHRDKWQGCGFDWILKNRTEMREKLDAIKKSNGGSPPEARADPKDPFAIPGLLKLDPNCPLCHGDWRNSKEPCSCLHPVEDDNGKPEAKRTAPPATC